MGATADHVGLVPRSGPAPTSDDPLAAVIVCVVDALKADFGERYKRAFETAEELRQFKRRLYSLLRGKPIPAIVDGYERCVAEKPGLIPTAPEIAAAVDAVAAEQRQEDAEDRRAQYARARLPVPEEAPYRRGDGAEALKLLAQAMEDSGRKDEAARRERLVQKLADHEAMIADAKRLGHIRNMRPAYIQCAGGCGHPGAIGHGTTGNTRWYCRDCFTRA